MFHSVIKTNLLFGAWMSFLGKGLEWGGGGSNFK